MVVNRLPESRRAVTRNPELVFQKVNEILVQSSNLYRDPCSKLIQLNSSLCPTNVPLKTRKIEEWPLRTDACCLHCSEPCTGTPLPVVHFYDPVASSYWLSGYFCRPCCSLAYIQNDSQFNSDRTRCNMWTREVLSKFFKLNSTLSAPPRAALRKYGGPLSLSEFYGEDVHKTRFIEIHSAPFVSFAMYAEVMTSALTKAKQQDSDKNLKLDEGIQQPLLRTDPIAIQECTKKPSLLLEYLTNLALKTNINEDESLLSKTTTKRIKKNSLTTLIINDDPQKSIHSKHLQNQNQDKSESNQNEEEPILKKPRKPRSTKAELAENGLLKVPKTILKRAKKMEMQDEKQGNKTRSLLSYTQKTN
jgi:hypothetical protein